MSASPIFILGMLQRTGTNHLWDLFGLHPDVEQLAPVFEDHLMQWSPHLFAYVDDVTNSWSDDWNVPADERTSLTTALGSGISSWIADRSTQRVVTKMPSVEQAQRFFDLFPGSPLVLIVRDGRNVSESMTTTFSMSYERAFRRWTRAADVVLQLQREHGDNPLLSIVTYEELVDHPSEVMARLCATTGLDVDRYPFDEIEQLPVRGSSTLRSDGEGDMHWAPVERTDDFDPHSRWSTWDDHTHRRFAAVAGPQQRALGYDLIEPSGSAGAVQQVQATRDLVSVRLRELKVLAGRALRNARRTHGRI